VTVSSADLAKALNSVWDASGLNAKFKALWSSATDEFQVLNDQEAAPDQRWPYCVFEMSAGETTDRMSGQTNLSLWEIRDIPVVFTVQAKVVTGDSRTAKGIAAYLAEEIMKVYGGHPTVHPTPLTLDNGNFLITQYQSDMGVRTSDDEYSWLLSYLFRLDIPVMV